MQKDPNKPLVLGESDMSALTPWVRLADDLGVPRSVGQLYGLLFLSEQPLSAQECADLLQISRSSAGQGLRTLKEFGAIKSTFALGDRSERFVIEPDLGVLIGRLIEGRLLPAFAVFFNGVQSQSIRSDANAFCGERLDKLKRWEAKLAAAVNQLKDGIL